MPEDVKFSISLPDGRQTEWDQKQYNKGANTLFEKYPDAQVNRISGYSEQSDLTPDSSFHITLDDGRETDWNYDQFSKGRETLLKKYPNAKISVTDDITAQRNRDFAHQYEFAQSKADDINMPDSEKQPYIDFVGQHAERYDKVKDKYGNQYNGRPDGADRLVEIYSRMEALQKELEELPQERDYRGLSREEAVLYAQEANSPEGRRRSEIKKELEQLRKERETNPAWQAYWNKTEEDLPGLIDAMDAKAKEYANVGGRSANMSDQEALDLIGGAEEKQGNEQERDYYLTARKYYKEALETAKAPSKYDDSWGIVNFAKGAGANITSAVSILELAKSLQDVNLINTVKQIQQAEGKDVNLIDLVNNESDKLNYLSDGQKEMLKAFAKRYEVEQGRSDNMSIGYNAGKGAITSLGFMGDFLVTGGLGEAAGKAVAKKLAKTTTEEIAGKTLGAQTKKLLVGNLEGATKALVMTPMMPSSYANFINNLTQLNADGQMDLSAKAVGKAIEDGLIETFSENAGELFGIPFEGKIFEGISKSKLGEVGKAMSRTGAGQFLKQAGWHGLVGEMAEEVLGNAMRSALNVDENALKDFFSGDQFWTTLASFAPMSIIGAGASGYQVRKAGKQMTKYGDQLKTILNNLGLNEDQMEEVEFMLDLSEVETPEELGSSIAKVGRLVGKTGLLTNDIAPDLGMAMGQYLQSAAEYKTLRGIFEEEQDIARAQNTALLDEQVGNKSWYHEGENGANYVRTITDAEGNERFVVNSLDGQYALIGKDGSYSFLTNEELEAGIADGSLTDSGEQPINSYLDGIAENEQRTSEQERMAEETASQISAIQQRIAENPSFNIGTEEAPITASVTAANETGVHVVWTDSDGQNMAQDLTWEQVGNYLGTPVEVKTDEQIEDEEVQAEEDIRSRKEDYNKTIPEGTEFTAVLVEGEEPVTYQFKRAFINEDGTMMLQVTDKETGKDEQITEEMALQGNLTSVLDSFKTPAEVQQEEVVAEEETPVDDGVLRDFRGNPIPLKDDGSVNQTALWNADPEAWAKWNDSQRNDGGANSRGYIAKATKKLQSDAKAVQKQIAKELDFDKIESLEGQLAGINNRIADLERIENNYANAEVAQAEAEQTPEEVPAPVAPVAEVAEEAPVAETVPEVQEEQVPLTPDQVLEGRLAEAKTPEEKRQALEDYYAITTTDPTIVGTRSDILQRMEEVGCPSFIIEAVRNQLNKPNQLTEGFRAHGYIFINADDIRNVKRAKQSHFHEHWHNVTREKGYARQLVSGIKIGVNSLLKTVNEMAGVKNGYDEYLEYPNPEEALADEVISLSMEVIADSTPENVDENLRNAGLDNEEIINFVKTIYDGERRNDQEVPLARRGPANDDNLSEENQRQDGRDSSTQPEGDVVSSGSGVEGIGGEGIGAGEQVTPQNELTKEITANLGGQIEGEGGNQPTLFSIKAIAEGVGFQANEGNESGNVTFTTGDGRVFDGHHPLTVEDVKGEKNSVMNYMMEDARRFGTITPEQEENIWQKYTDVLNRMLEKGLKENGGYENLSSQWQWVGETVFKTVSPNSDEQYLYSLDITRVCKKNEAVINSISAMQRRVGYGITPGQIMDIYLSSIEEGYQVPCPVCYVFSRYIANGKYATIAINGQKKYGKYLVDPSSLSDKERKERIKFWVSELEKQEKKNEANEKKITKAKQDISNILDQIDKLGKTILEGKSSEAEKQAALKEIEKLDKRYKAALNVVSQSSLTSWIKTFAIKKVKGGWKLYDDSFQGFPEEYALDLRLTAETIRKYPAIQRLRKSGGSAAGKEIHFAANNDIGDVTMMLGASNLKTAQNYYKTAVEAKTEKERAAALKDATERFRGAMVYAQMQSLRGGQRMWSWSDNIERLAPDVFVNLMQLQMLGGALQSYSKQLEGANLVATMGGYVNGSLMAYGIGYQVVDADAIDVVDGKEVLKNDITDTVTEKTAEGDRQRTRFLAKAGSPVFTDKDGKKVVLLFDDVVGIDAYGRDVDGVHMKGLFDLNATLDKAGNILVGMDDTHIRAAMADDRVFFIIPWHASGQSVHILTQMLGYLGVDIRKFNPKDYTNVQEEKSAVGEDGKIIPNLVEFWEAHNYEADYKCGIEGGIPSGKNGKLSKEQKEYRALRDAIFTDPNLVNDKARMRKIKADEFLSQVWDKVHDTVSTGQMTKGDTKFIYPYEYWDEDSTYENADVNGKRYLEYCRRMGVKPKFIGKLDGNPEKDFGNFADDKGFWKLLIDRRMYKVDGSFQDLTPVSTEEFTPDLIDPKWTEKEFVVTTVADSEGVERIAERAIQKEQERPGGLASVNYDMTLEQAIKEQDKVTEPKLTKAQRKKLTQAQQNVLNYLETGEFQSESQASSDENVQFRLSNMQQMDQDYMAAVEAGDMDTAQRMVDEMAEAAGYTIRGYHGTTHDFTIFDRSKGNAEGNWGKGFYFTNNEDDAEANYAGEGPDLTNRIEHLAENMEWMDGYEDMSYEQRVEEARKQLAGDNPHVISAAIKMENPVVFDSRYGQDETYFDYDVHYNEETDEYEGEPTGKLADFVEAWNDVLYDFDYQNVSPDPILEYAEYDGLTASQLENKAREILDSVGGIMTVDGEYASGEFLRQVFERMGFDGIVDNNVNMKFGSQRRIGRGMDGMDYGTTHVIAFNSNQIKQTDPVTYDDEGNVIPLSKRFDSWNEDIRFRKANQTQNGFISNAEAALDKIKMDRATPEQWVKMLEKEGGLKAGEDKWLGLSDWLKAYDKKTLTKDEIADFIEQNRIQIEEQRYSEMANLTEERDAAEALQRYQDEFDSFASDYINGDVEYAYSWPSASAYAFEQMVEKYGDDFRLAFEVDGNTLAPMQEFDDDFNGATRHFLGLDTAEERRINPVRLDYTTPGLDNKAEIALTVPTIDSWNESDMVHFGDAGEGRAIAWIRFGDTTISENTETPSDGLTQEEREELNRLEEEVAERGRTFREARSQEEMDSAEGPLKEAMARRDAFKNEHQPKRTEAPSQRVLVIDEIQSKRHQEGREKGYADKNSIIVKREDKGWSYSYSDSNDNGFVSDLIAPTEEEARNYAAKLHRGAVPAAPFEKNWHELAMKRMLRLAAEEGYDKIAWTTGDQQVERYNLSNIVDKVGVNPTTKGEHAGNRIVQLYLRHSDGDYKNLVVDKDGMVIQGDFTGQKLSAVVGGELAAKIMGVEGGREEISGDGLRVGGEGMRGFYDDILPRFMNKYGKKWGVKVQDIELPGIGDTGLTMHSVDVTPEMKESVMEGQVMFRKTAPNGKPSNLTDDQWEQVRTPEFKAWFGDWENDPENASKVVDENGEPRVVYHGSTWNPLKEEPGKAVFDENRVGENFDWVDIDWNFFFTASEASAKGYGRAIPVFLNIRNMEVHTIRESISYEMDEETGHDIVVTAHDAGSENDEVTKVDNPDGVMYTIRAVDVKESERRFADAIKQWEGEHRQELEDEYNSLKEQSEDLIKQMHDEYRKLYDELGFQSALGMGYEEMSERAGYVVDQVVKDAAKLRGGVSTEKLDELEKQFNDVDQKMFKIFQRQGIEGRPTYEEYEQYEVEKDYKTTDIFAVDRPNQIKSAVANNGNFSPDNDDIRFSLRGIIGAENAEDEAALDNLEVAEEMENAGKDSQAIWKATGWEKGVDGKWRNEIPDAKQKEGVSLQKHNIAGEILDAPELFSSYPELTEIPIDLVSSAVAGAYNRAEKRITIDTNYNTKDDGEGRYLNTEGIKTVLHELQHAIQAIEGFAKGMNEKLGERLYYRESLKTKPEETYFAWFFSRKNSSRKLNQVGREKVIRFSENYDKSTLTEQDKVYFANLINYLKGISDSEFKKFVSRAAKLVKTAEKAGEESYEKSAGEVEARNVERRSRMSDEDRKKYSPEITEDYSRSEQGVRFRKRTKEDPKETIKVYKLMRLEDGKKLPLFIDRNSEPLEDGQWYDADSPDLAFLKEMPSGIFLVDADNGTYTSLKDYQRERGAKATKWPTIEDVNEASSKGLRWMKITDTEKGQKRYEGENRKYENIGINGSDGVSTFAMRPGWHAGSLPTMRQIGKGAEKNIRDDNFVWVEGEIPADIDYNEEAQRNPDKDIPTHIPTDGFYMKATNVDKAKSQADRVGWYVAGAFKPNRVIGDLEARQIIDDWNAEHPDAKVEYDWPREGNRIFNADTMQLEEAPANEEVRFRVTSLEDNYDGKWKGNYVYVGPKAENDVQRDMLNYIMRSLNDSGFNSDTKPWDAIGYVMNYISDMPEEVPTWTLEEAEKFKPEMFLTKARLEQEKKLRSDNFKDWFGDWENDPKHASKVVDESGHPLEVYHGTREGVHYKFKASPKGNFFTSDYNVAYDYAFYDNDYGEEDEDAIVHSVYLNIRKPFIIDADFYDWKSLPTSYKGLTSGSTTTDGWARYLKSLPGKKYDGLIVKNVSDGYGYDAITTVYVTFEPNQIKSSENNNGEYSRNNDDIRFRLANRKAIRDSREGGLTGVIGDENAAELYRNVYKAVPKEIRQQIVDKAGDGYLFSEATKDMISEAVEKGDETGIAGLAANMLRDYAGPLDERTARYILWRGDRKVEDDDLLDTVNDIAMQRRLKVGRFAEQPMFRLADNIEDAENRANSMADDAKATLNEKKEFAKVNDALTTIKAMSLQKEYDRKTVNTITVLAKNVLKDQSIETLSRHEIARLLGIVTTSIGKAPKTVKKNADALMGMVIDHMLKSEETKLGMLASIRGTKTNQTGVETAAKLDPRGQNILKAYKEGLEMDLTNPDDRDDADTLDGRLIELSEKLESKNEVEHAAAEEEYAGLMLAKEYQEEIKASRNEERRLRREMNDAAEEMKDGKRSRTAYNQLVEENEKAIRENKIERVEAYQELYGKMSQMIAGSIETLREFKEDEKARVEKIHHLANSDMQGRDATVNPQTTWAGRLANSSVVRFFTQPLATFEQILRLFGEKNIAGEGYLFNYFHRNWIKASENAYLGEKEAKDTLDAKVSEVFDEKMRWNDLYTEERRMPKVTVKWWDSGRKEMVEHELTQGQLLYIYMVNKMTDGRMKLRRMGITQETVDAIKKQMDVRFIELADWLQSEFLVNLRDKYDAVHTRLFGAHMAAIEDYFPLKMNKNSLDKAEDIGRPDLDDALPATSTGAIIKRRRNTKDLDLLNADAFSVVIEHVEQMEQWAAFAEYNKDLNTLLSYKRFRNQVKGMTSVYGSGNELLKNFEATCRIVGGTYRPAGNKSGLDRDALSIAKGVTAAKISFRVYTALKQLLSMPAFVADANVKYLGQNIATPWKAWNWAMDNLPLFEKRWKSRQAGDTRLMQNESDWKFFQSQLYDNLSRLGMSPNAFVDAMTVSIGAHSIYQTRYDRYIKDGYTEEEADKKAKEDATTLYNETQQSSESAFVSKVQLDRTVAAAALTVFRNSSMGYQRQLHDAIRNFGKLFKPGYKVASVEFMKKQMEGEGLTEEQAQEAAERNFNRETWRSLARIGTFGFLVQFAWNLGPYLAYLLFGGDDDKKEDMLKEAAVHGLVGGSVEGLVGGSLLSEVFNKIAKKESLNNYDPSLLPIVSDVKNTYKKMSYNPVAGWYDLTCLAAQALAGVNPQTLSDAVVAVVDACDGDLETSREAMLLFLRVIQTPQSQLDQLYIDELGLNGEGAKSMSMSEMAERYARYKMNKEAGPLVGLHSEESEKKRRDTYNKRFKQLVKERKEINKPKDKK